MKFPRRDKSLPHQLDIKFETGTGIIIAYCNCGQEFARDRVVYAAQAIHAYHLHLGRVRLTKLLLERARERAERFH